VILTQLIMAARAGAHGARRVDHHRSSAEMLIHPGGREGHKREPEEQVQVGPQHSSSYPVNELEQVVVVVPVDAQIHEAQQVGQQPGCRLSQRVESWLARDVQLQHHDRDDDREYRVAECLKPASPHTRESRKRRALSRTTVRLRVRSTAGMWA